MKPTHAIFHQLAQTTLVAVVVFLLAACAHPINAKVTRFNQWPADTLGATFSFIRPADALNDLEQQAYEGKVQVALEKLGLKRAAPGQVGRMHVDLVASNSTRNIQTREAVYRDNYLYHPSYRDATGRFFGSFWAPDPFGPRYAGDRSVTRTIQVSNLHLRLLDTQVFNAGDAPGRPRAVFESRAVYEGSNEDLATLVPFLVRAVFDDFPGQNAKVRNIQFDSKTGALLKN
jgi:hypothetical protein